MTSSDQYSSHEVYAELAAGWALHALEPDDEARFAGHLGDCDHCAAAVEDYLVLLSEMAGLMPAAEPPASLGARIHDAVHADLDPIANRNADDRAPLPPVVVLQPERRRREFPPAVEARPATSPSPVVRLSAREPRRLVLAAAALAAVLAIGGTVAVGFDRAQTADQLAVQLARRDADIAQARGIAKKRAEVLGLSAKPGVSLAVLADEFQVKGYVILRDGIAEVMADGLGANDTRSTTYVLWLLPHGGGVPQPLQSFDVASAFRSTGSPVRLPSGARAEGFAVSLEPGRQMPSKPTTVVANGEVES